MTRFSAVLFAAALGCATSAPAVAATVDPAAAAVLDRYIQAIGGRAELERIKTVETISESTLFGTSQKMYHIEDRPTRRFYTRNEGPSGTAEVGFDGTRVWRRTAFFRGYLSNDDPQAKALTGERFQRWQYRESGRDFAKLPNETIDGKELLVVGSTTFAARGAEVPIKLYFDSVTYLLVRAVTGTDVTSVETLSDYRKVDGGLVAFSLKVETPQATIERRIVSVRQNVPLDESLFRFETAANATPSGALASPSPTASAAPGMRYKPESEIPEDERIKTFEFLWKTVNDTYPDLHFGGVDWRAVHDRYLPQARATRTSGPFHKLLATMVNELNQSHFHVFAPDQTLDLQSTTRERMGSVDLNLRLIDGRLVVVDLDPSGSAYRGGLRDGFVLTAIGGETVEALRAAAKRDASQRSLDEAIDAVRAANRALAGKSGTTVTVTALDEQDRPHAFELVRELPPLASPLHFTSKTLPGNVGYIKFDIFLGNLLDQFRAALSQMRDTKGLIIDLRGNPGGVGDLSPAIANLLSSDPGSLGTSQFRYSTRKFEFAGSGNDAYKGRVIILVDELSGSTSEVFSGGLQEMHRATVVGLTTARAVLPSIVTLLPTGGAFQHVVSDFRTPNGRALEGQGVVPDVIVSRTRKGVLAGRDEQLERALDLLRSDLIRADSRDEIARPHLPREPYAEAF
jgi:carboxyl-terminal processing protease